MYCYFETSRLNSYFILLRLHVNVETMYFVLLVPRRRGCTRGRSFLLCPCHQNLPGIEAFNHIWWWISYVLVTHLLHSVVCDANVADGVSKGQDVMSPHLVQPQTYLLRSYNQGSSTRAQQVLSGKNNWGTTRWMLIVSTIFTIDRGFRCI